MWDLDIFGIDIEQRAYLKKTAIETCINFIGRTISLSEFRFMKDGKRVKSNWDYSLNVRPNTNQSAADFWQDFVYKLLYENEVLVIPTDKNDFLIADSYDRVEYAVYPDVFKNVVVKGFQFKKTFPMDEVIYISYNNEKFTRFLDGMFKDYTELFSRMIETNMYANQIRAIAGVDGNTKLDDESRGQLQGFIDKMFNAFRKKAFAIVPQIKGFNYEEITSGEKNSGRHVEELEKLKKDLTSHVANILGIPATLIHGDMAEYETALKAYIKFCIKPLIKKIQDELNAKLIDKNDYMNGERIKIFGVAEMDPLELANAIDKLVASMVYTPNEVRVMLGDEPSTDERLNKHYFTKNYQELDSVEGGEQDET
ncbi:phage portal protein [Lysinibacillus sphaericus]|uniref:Phage portal protein n=1 Tax=Lysinibacillus sphaericus TaxID=1421 RepID=A0A544U8A5_LYSSH|nr:phage portal protein [Lysinibacillus sp. SDF0037]TQR28329.1 phage portal protein [Lysinibacillus sp. SDF0037]